MSEKWDNRFLDLAAFIAGWSKDPSTKCGAVIIDTQRRVVSVGYNGFPQGVSDDPDRLAERVQKYYLTMHAEANALLFAQRAVKGYTIYTWPFQPCSQCASSIAQVGIARVVAPVMPENKDRWHDDFKAARGLLLERGVRLDLVPETLTQEARRAQR